MFGQRRFVNPKGKKAFWWTTAILSLLLAGKLLWPHAVENYTGVVNGPLTYDNSRALTPAQFEELALSLTREHRQALAASRIDEEDSPFARRVKMDMLMNTRSFLAQGPYPHIDYFRKAGLRQYEGPQTCLTCHESMQVQDGKGIHSVHTLNDVVNSVHFTFQSSEAGFTTYGFDGRQVNGEGIRPIPMGKIDRACGIPGTFSWTGWAELIKSKPHGGPEVMRSEGCGQCHIGGNYHPATEKMLPAGDVPSEAKEGIDCLICHSRTYDMNFRHVIEDEGGRRWNQDRTLGAALTVGLPGNDNCLNCHQHNLGGDLFAENMAAKKLGYMNPRILHPGAKRATPFAPENDVHAAAGLQCTDCHIPEGHKIPRGVKGTDLVANDLPGKVVACENCHTAAPHVKSDERALLNGHVERVACESCHIRELHENNLVLRDWTHPIWDEEEGIFIPADILQSGKAKEGFIYLWFNGNGTFLANPLGDNPLGGNGYDPFMAQLVTLDDADALAEIRRQVEGLQTHYPDLDVDRYMAEATHPLSQLTPEMLARRKQMVEENMRPLMRAGKSKLYPFKLFNARMYEDLNNEGPFGAMILPFDYPTYYEGGDPQASLKKALSATIIKRMYETPFKTFMMDAFMGYFGVGQWRAEYPLQGDTLKKVDARWMRQMGALMINHGISRDGLGCKNCHANNGGRLDFAALGYPPERVNDLRNLPELQ